MVEYFNHPNNSDKWIVDLCKGKKGGYFAKAGALDSIDGSCTYTLENYDTGLKKLNPPIA